MSRGRSAPWKTSAERAELLAIYARVDALMAPFSCDASTECCRFGVTGREPYATPPEIAELDGAIAALGGARALVRRATGEATARRLAVVDDERRCPLLDDEGRCRAYAARPLGCRTFFCDRARGPRRFPRDEVNRATRDLAALAARVAPEAPHGRPLTRVLAEPAEARAVAGRSR